jgi:hypothetical protein
MDPLNNINRLFSFGWGRQYLIIEREGNWYRIRNIKSGTILKLQVSTVLANCTSLY